jgi:ABC-type bacteriocin/lantibiotic exporter with double-glycine peptidase domain
MQRVISDVLIFYIDFTKQFIKVSTLWDVFDKAPEIKGYSTGLLFSPQDKNIEIRNITYGYNESKVFSDFSLTLARGKKTALVGASGGGKTTLMKLIAGYLHPESGSISVMGNNL